MTAPLLAGMAKREITPPTGTPMGAFPVSREPMQPRLAEGVHDPLWARALALRQGATTVVVCAVDVVAFQWPDVDCMRAVFAEQTGLAPEALVVCGTHNHNGPECTYLFGGDPEAEYMDRVRGRTVEAAAAAVSELTPCRVATGVVDADLAFNRRLVHPDGRFQQCGRQPGCETFGPVDPKVSVLRLERLGGEGAWGVVHFAAHPVILSTPNRLFTSEYPGVALRRFGMAVDVQDAVFLQGACGDTHPYEALVDEFEGAEQMGRKLAQGAERAWAAAADEGDVELRVGRWRGHADHRFAPDCRLRLEITAVRVSPRLSLLFLQGEPFVELSLQTQWRSPFARTIVGGYALGWIGYVPTRQAYEFGGYGVDLYTLDPPEFSRTAVSPGTGELLADQAVELLRGLRPD